MQSVTDSMRQQVRQRPDRRPVMYQSWRDLLMLHWRMDPDRIRPWLPPGLTVDCYDGSAWISIVPFRMRNIRPRGLPALPHVSFFLELNLRTYAFDRHGTPGVWFFSLNANRRLAVHVARRWFHLPYRFARMSAVQDENGWIDYRMRRQGTRADQACRYRYRRQGDVFHAEIGTLDYFLAERYVLFASLPGGGTASGQVHHAPYPLQAAEVSLADRRLIELDGLTDPQRPHDHASFSAGVDVEVFALVSTP